MGSALGSDPRPLKPLLFISIPPPHPRDSPVPEIHADFFISLHPLFPSFADHVLLSEEK